MIYESGSLNTVYSVYLSPPSLPLASHIHLSVWGSCQKPHDISNGWIHGGLGEYQALRYLTGDTSTLGEPADQDTFRR
jgi:hypothetical protein